MADTHRRPVINLAQDLVENGDAYDFYQAVKLLHRLAPTQPAEPKATATLRIQPELNLDYPQADIAAIGRDAANGGYHVTTTFFGLYGVSSPLPGFYTEELLDDEWDELGSRKAFFDIIHNQIYPLLYQAWLKYRFGHNLVEFDDPKYAEIIFSLIGLGAAYRKSPGRYGYLLKYAGLLGQRVKSLAGLKTMLRDHLPGLGIDIRPCVPRKVPIVKQQRCLLGRQHTTLGEDAWIGQQVEDRAGKFSIELGPLGAERFASLMQYGDTFDRIRTLTRLYLVQPLEQTIALLLEPGAEQPARLGDADGTLLGTNCWLIDSPNREIERIELPAFDR